MRILSYFFPDGEPTIPSKLQAEEAKRACREFSVRVEYLDEALRGAPYGVWGRLSEEW